MGYHILENWFAYTTTVVLVTILSFLFINLKQRGRKYKLPPGPSRVPIIGNILGLMKQPFHLTLHDWAYEFGEMYTVYFGTQAAVVVNDVATMKEVFAIFPASTGKFSSDIFEMPFRGKYGFVPLAGHKCFEQRQFCVKHLKPFGFGKGLIMEPMIVDEINDLMAWIHREGADGAKPVVILYNLQKATFNTIWTLVTGQKIPLGDTRFVNIIINYMGSVQKAVRTGLTFLPWLKYIAPELSGYKFADKSGADLNRFVWECFEEHKTGFQEGTPRDLIDAFLEQMKNEKDPSSTFYGEEGWKHAVASVSGLFVGGGETTATTLNWLVFYMCCNPSAQRKLQEEIDQVVGRDREPSLTDKPSMPYTDAVIMETLRKSTFTPVGLIHEFIEDTSFQKYNIQQGTLLIANIYHAHYNKKTWGDPEYFRPERFLTGDVSLRENVVAFQVGRRQCVGESLARDAIFLFVTKLFQKFTFSTDPNISREEYLEPDMGFCLKSKYLPVVVRNREGLN